jgi:hypothetical protein
MTERTEKLDLGSLNISAEKWQELLDLFPEVRTEDGKIDFDRLKLALGETLDVGKQRYGLNWPNEMDSFCEVKRPKAGNLTVEVLSAIFDPFEEIVLHANKVDTQSNTHIIPKIAMGESIDVRLTGFIPSLSTVSPEELELLKTKGIHSGFDFIDFWTVDFDYCLGKPFTVIWRAFSKVKKRSLQTVTDRHFQYRKGGKHLICVNVVDIFGAETSTITEVNWRTGFQE